MKKVLSILLSLFMLLSITAGMELTAYADYEEFTEGYYTYTVTDGKAIIIDCDTSISGDVTIPSKLGGYTVTCIDEYAFNSRANLKSVAIPDSVTSISGYAFNWCTGLTSVTIGNGVTSIGGYAFYCCESLKSVTIGNGVTSIGESAFDCCTSLPIITIPNSVTSIGDAAFNNCESLKSVTIGNGVTSIGDSAFEYCEKLANVYYTGSKTDWNMISIYGNNEFLTNATIHYNYVPHAHTYKNVVTAPTCTQQGYTTHTCSCGDTYVDDYVNAKGHTSVSSNNAVAATCTTAGKNGDTKCSVCGVTLTTGATTSALGHSWDSGVITKAPTETATGIRTYTCKRSGCGETKTEVIPVLTHTHNYNSVVTAPTCTEKGYTTYTCSCGDSYVDNYVNAKGHTSVSSNNAVAATCTTAGKNSDTKCSVCGVTLTTGATTSALGHSWDSGVITKAPTETATGIRTYTCKRSGCGATKTEVIPVLTHTHNYNSVVTAPTCTEKGYTTYTCACGVSYVDNYVNAKGHNYSNGICTICACAMPYGEEDENGITIIKAGMPLNYVCHADGWHEISFQPETSGYYSISITNKSCEENTAINIFDSEYNFLAYQSSNESKDNLIYQYFNSGELYYIDAEYWNLKSHDGESFTINVEPHTTHTYATTKATTTKNGVVKCKDCGNVKSTIYYPKTITLSTTSYTYDGKVKKPSVTVKDGKGKTISSSNYTVSYASGRKNVGKYAVKITFKGNYSGTKTLSFTIKPKATSISKLTAGKKAFTVKWKKQATQTTGYEIQYATDSKFTKNKKTVAVSKNSTTSKTISKLKSKKKYYVRIRTYKTVSGTKYYSSWSKAKTVITKK